MIDHPEHYDEEGNRMTDTATTRGTRQPVPVSFGLRAIPGPPTQHRIGTPSSPVHEFLRQIATGQVAAGPEQWYELAFYPTEDKRAGSAASAKAGDLRKRYPSDDGWEFKVGSVEDERGPGKIVAVRKVV